MPPFHMCLSPSTDRSVLLLCPIKRTTVCYIAVNQLYLCCPIINDHVILAQTLSVVNEILPRSGNEIEIVLLLPFWRNKDNQLFLLAVCVFICQDSPEVKVQTNTVFRMFSSTELSVALHMTCSLGKMLHNLCLVTLYDWML